MFGSYLGIIIYGSQALGGAARVWDLSYQAGRVELFNLDPDPRQRHTLWCDDSDNYSDDDDDNPQGTDGGHHRVVGLSVRHQPGHGPALLHTTETLPGDDSDSDNDSDNDDDNDDDHQVVTALRLNGFLMAVLIGLCSYGGMVMFAFYRSGHSAFIFQKTEIYTGHTFIQGL